MKPENRIKAVKLETRQYFHTDKGRGAEGVSIIVETIKHPVLIGPGTENGGQEEYYGKPQSSFQGEATISIMQGATNVRFPIPAPTLREAFRMFAACREKAKAITLDKIAQKEKAMFNKMQQIKQARKGGNHGG